MILLCLLTSVEVSIVSSSPIVATQTGATNEKKEADRLFQSGAMQYTQGQFNDALKSWQQALELYQKIHDRANEGETIRNIGRVYYVQHDFTKAQAFFEKSLAIAREVKNRKNEGRNLANLGDIYGILQQWDKVVAYYQQSIKIAQEIGDKQGAAIYLERMGKAYKIQSDFTKTISYWESSLKIWRELHDRKGEARLLLALADAYFNQFYKLQLGWCDQASKYYEQSLAIVQEIKDQDGEWEALYRLGICYDDRGEHLKAIPLHQRRLALAWVSKDLLAEAETWNELGLSYNALKEYPKAIESYQKAASIYREQQKKSSSTEDKEMLLEMRQALTNLGDAYHSHGEYAKAIASYQDALSPQANSTENISSFDIKLFSKLGITFARIGKLPEAEAALRKALGKDEIIRIELGTSEKVQAKDSDRIFLAEMQADNYRRLQQVLVRQNRTDEALETAEKGRARAFVELLASRISGRPLLQDAGLSIAPKINAIRQIAQEHNATLVQYSRVDDDQLYIWVIKPNGAITFKSVNLKNTNLNKLISQTRQSISSHSRLSGDELRQLHQILIEPIAVELPNDPNAQVIFIPQGSLFLVAFPALQNAQGKYLIQQHTLSTAPSIQTLALTQKQRKSSPKSSNSLIVGNPKMPIFEGEALPPLPGAEKEAIAIAQILNIKAMTGNQATKPEVLKQMQTASIVHLATHGLLDAVNGGIPGAIALAPSANDSGLLTANEIFDLKLKVNLVVLSACNTGRGKITGDGVVGLSRSFVAAGVPSIVVSLWAVNDNSTSVLMGEFYRNLKTNPNKARALRQAMLSTLKQYPNPLDWAAFTLIGEA